jgi:hypothetical protein
MKDKSYSVVSDGGLADAGPSAEEASTGDLADGELSDGELEHVVGGLARAWFEGVPGVAALRDYQRGAPSALGL